jgi:predicted ribosome quality control (RQC) complex YloA/Tae2 family protein
MRLELDFGKSVEENASRYFEEAKRAKRKLAGLAHAIEQTKKELAKLQAAAPKKRGIAAKRRGLRWFHAFHWFFSSDGFLVLAGRNAKSNEQLVKKHLEKGDFFLHTEMPGGAACVIKGGGKSVPERTFREAACFAAVFSKAWSSGLPSADVYAVNAEQVSKKAPSKSFLPSGSFMVYGKRKWFKKTPLLFAVGFSREKEIVSGPPAAIKKNAVSFVLLGQGNDSAEDAAKKIARVLGGLAKGAPPVSVGEIARMIPSRGIAVKEAA